ncbi:heavy metal-binding domain-containing protein [Streptomyces sp. NPDC006332]|uniref:heavy metal-binding domain-containing protein n=1 Tax=Streptomyces sp. NPDC006332 TaxID=3155456 RepID=UPI0033B82328
MEIYTTDVVPTTTAQPSRAWLVWSSSANGLEEALSNLREQARAKGADAIVGLRVTASQGSNPKYPGTWTVFTAYGTGVKQPSVSIGR